MLPRPAKSLGVVVKELRRSARVIGPSRGQPLAVWLCEQKLASISRPPWRLALLGERGGALFTALYCSALYCKELSGFFAAIRQVVSSTSRGRTGRRTSTNRGEGGRGPPSPPPLTPISLPLSRSPLSLPFLSPKVRLPNAPTIDSACGTLLH